MPWLPKLECRNNKHNLAKLGAAVAFLLIGGLLLFFFDTLFIIREAFAWLLTFKGTAQVYAIRRATAPFWRVVTRCLTIVFGVKVLRLIRRRLDAGLTEWKRLPGWVRWTAVSLALFLGALMGFGVWLLPLWLPVLKPMARRIWFMIVDRAHFPYRRRFRRFARSNRVMRAARRPHRVGLYWVARGIRSGGRWARDRLRPALPRSS